MIGYVEAIPIRGDRYYKRQMKKLYQISVTYEQTYVTRKGKTIIDVKEVITVRMAGYKTYADENDDIHRVLELLGFHIENYEPITVETDKYAYTLVSVYENGSYRSMV